MPVLTHTRTARAYWTLGKGIGGLREERLPRVGIGEGGTREELLVRTAVSGVCRGAESLVHGGRIPQKESDRMRARHQQGAFPFPVKYGFSSVGVVEEGPPSWIDRTVFCPYPHQDHYVVPATEVVPVPDAVPLRRAALATQLEIAINAVWDAKISLGDRVAVVGAGVIGLLSAWLVDRVPGTEVVVLDRNPERAAPTRALGLDFVEADAATFSDERRPDVVIHASGTAHGVAAALRHARDDGTVIDVSWFGPGEGTLPLGEAFQLRRLTIRASHADRVPPGRASGWSRDRRLRLALELLRARELDVLFTSSDAFEDITEAMPRILGDPSTLCATFHYDGE